MTRHPEIESLRAKLTLERGKMLAALDLFMPEELTQADNEGRSVKDILAHVAHAEKVNVKFARLMLEKDKPVQLRAVAADFPDYTGAFDLDRFNAYVLEKLRGEPLETVLRSLTEERAATLVWTETLDADALDRTGEHAAWGEQTVRGILKILILHDKMHTQEIVKRAGKKERDG